MANYRLQTDKVKIKNVNNFRKNKDDLEIYLNHRLKASYVDSMELTAEAVIVTFNEKIDYYKFLSSVRTNSAPDYLVVRRRKNLYIEIYKNVPHDHCSDSDSDKSDMSNISSVSSKRKRLNYSSNSEKFSIDLSSSPHRLNLVEQSEKCKQHKVENTKVIINGSNAFNTKMLLLEQLSKVVKVPVNLPKGIQRSNEGLNGMLRKARSISDSKEIVIDKENNLIAWNKEDVDKFQRYIFEHVKSKKSNILVSDLMNSDTLNKKLNDLMNEYKVCFTKSDKFICIYGIEDATKLSNTDLEDYWTKNASTKIIYKESNKLKFRVLEKYFKSDIEKICKNSPINFDKRLSEIEINGFGLNEVQIRKQLEQFSSAIAEETFSKNSYGLKQFIKNDEFKLKISSIEENNRCIIESTGDNSVIESIPQAISSDNNDNTSESDDDSNDDSDEEDNDGKSTDGRERRTNTLIKIIPEKGNIIAYKNKAQLLVNNIANDKRDINKGGNLSTAFLKEFPELSTVPITKYDNYVSTSKLSNISICHANITSIKRQEKEKCIKHLGDTIQSILKLADSIGVNTIALPPIGTGKICGFRKSVVARKIRKGIISHCTFYPKTSVKTVFVVSFRDEEQQEMMKTLVHKRGKRPHVQPRSNNVSSNNPTIQFRIFGKGQTNTKNAKSDLLGYLKKLCLKETLDNFHDVQWTDLKDIENNYVKAKLDEKSNSLSIWGINDYVKKAVIIAREKRLEIKNAVSEGLSWSDIEKTADKKKRLEGLCKMKDKVPKYWKAFTPGISFITLFQKQNVHKVNIQEKETTLFKSIQSITEQLWRSNLYGRGKDATKNTQRASSIRVLKVERIENKQLYEKFSVRRAELIQKAINNKIKNINLGNEVIETESAIKYDLIPEINEHFLYHGAQESAIDRIIKDGFDSRCSVNKGLFGDGIYFAENPTKADQYVKDDRKGKMLLCRVVLGNVFFSDKPMTKSKRPPCLECKYEGTCHSHEDCFDSVLGTKKDGGVKLLFREFVVYENHLCYPEFVITYDKP